MRGRHRPYKCTCRLRLVVVVLNLQAAPYVVPSAGSANGYSTTQMCFEICPDREHILGLGSTQLDQNDVSVCFELAWGTQRENSTSPFSQHWLMRTCLCWSHQPKLFAMPAEWPLGNGKQLSGPCATQNTAWYHQHLNTTIETGDERGHGGHMQSESLM